MNIQKPNKFVQFFNVPVIRCLVPAEIDHSNTRLIRYLDPHCIWKNSQLQTYLSPKSQDTWAPSLPPGTPMFRIIKEYIFFNSERADKYSEHSTFKYWTWSCPVFVSWPKKVLIIRKLDLFCIQMFTVNLIIPGTFGFRARNQIYSRIWITNILACYSGQSVFLNKIVVSE
jgi:hypothetical protein